MINTLPVEMLSLIFRFAGGTPKPHLGTVDIYRQNLSLLRLTRVCQRWRSIAISYPILWQNIAFSPSRLPTVRCAAGFLRWSGSAVLKVQVIDGGDQTTIIYSAEAVNLIEEIAQQSHRIIEFEAVGLSELISEALIYKADIIRRLSITGNPFEKIPLVFGGQLPRLERLALSNPTGWRLSLFHGVTKVTLHLRECDLHINILLEFLEGACNLQDLSLSRYRDHDTIRTVDRQPVTLPSLRELNLSFCDTSRILSYLHVPSTARILILKGKEEKGRHIFQCLPNAPGFWRFLSTTDSLTLRLNSTSNEFHLATFHGYIPLCFLQIYEIRRWVDEGWILRSIYSASRFEQFFHLRSLTVSVDGHPIPWEVWISKLNGLAELDARSTNPEQLALALRPIRGRVSCPSLRYLTVEGIATQKLPDISTLRSSLLARAAEGHPVFRLRFRGRDWKYIARVDPCWEGLVRSQGGLRCVLNDFVTQRMS